MCRVSVNKNILSPYIEKTSWLHRFKRKFTYAFAFRLLKKYAIFGDPVNLLEIGTGSGYFLRFCRDVFPSYILHGIEYDQRLLDVTHLNAPFADCRQSNAEHFDFDNKQFDIIVSFQVIEHLFDPILMMQKAYKHLKPGGVLLITTPNLEGFGAKLMKDKWHGFRDDHVSLKSYKEWNDLITSCHFTKLYSGSTFFTGIPLLNCFPLGIFNWILLFFWGSLPWTKGESYVGVFRK